MRELSKIEQNVVKKICAGTNNIAGLITDFLQGMALEVNRDEDSLTIKIKLPDDVDNTNSKYVFEVANGLTEKIVVIVTLLNYLIEQGYLLTYYPAHGRTVLGHFLGEMDKGDFSKHPEKYSQHWTFTDDNVKQAFFQFLDIFFIPTEPLKDLASKNFKTQEQIRHRQNLIASWFGIAIAFTVGICGLGLTWSSNNKDKSTKIDTTQIKSINCKFDKAINVLDTISSNTKKKAPEPEKVPEPKTKQPSSKNKH